MTKWFWQNIILQNCPMEYRASTVDVAAKTAKACLQHLNAPYAQCHCVNHYQQRSSHLIAGLPKKNTGKGKKAIIQIMYTLKRKTEV